MDTENEMNGGSLRDTWAPETVTQPINPLADLQAADVAVNQARSDLQQAGINVQTARAELAKCLTRWNQGAPAMTPLEAAREFQAQSQAERRARAEAGRYYPPPTVSQMAKAFSGGGHNARRGGGRAYAGRNPFGSAQPLTKAQALEATALRIRAEKAAAAAAGLPEHE